MSRDSDGFVPSKWASSGDTSDPPQKKPLKAGWLRNTRVAINGQASASPPPMIRTECSVEVASCDSPSDSECDM